MRVLLKLKEYVRFQKKIIKKISYMNMVYLIAFLHNDIRSDLFRNAQFLNTNYNSVVKTEQFKFLFNSPNLNRPCAKDSFLMLQKWSVFLIK